MNNDLNILIIDSDSTVQADLEKKVTQLGFSLCATASPDQSIDQLDSLKPDLAISLG